MAVLTRNGQSRGTTNRSLFLSNLPQVNSTAAAFLLDDAWGTLIEIFAFASIKKDQLAHDHRPELIRGPAPYHHFNDIAVGDRCPTLNSQ
jgi:hypothetical protein